MNIFNFAQPVNQDAIAHGAQLYAKRNTATIVPFRSVTLGNWSPVVRECHDNVLKWVEHHPEHQAVHGWLYMGDQPDVVRFVAHSVVRSKDGTLFDITPKEPTHADYPFIDSGLNTDQYADILNPLCEQLGAGFLHHYIEIDHDRNRNPQG